MKRYKKNLGDFGEEAAASFLVQNGFEILDRNFLVRGGEIDIIAKDKETLVFVEVKTRSSDRFGTPAEAVDYKKIEHLHTAAERYLESNPTEAEIRFDVIEIEANIADGVPQLMNINHIRDAITF